MRILLFSFLLAGCATGSPNLSGGTPATSFKTTKSLPLLEQCLTKSLAERGVVTSVGIEGTKTLMLSEDTGTRMLIDLIPPNVTVTTRLAPGTRRLIEACL